MKPILKLLSACTLFVASHGFAAEALPPTLSNALANYFEKGADAFVMSLLKGSPLEADKSAQTQAASIKQIEHGFGSYQGAELIALVNISPRVRVAYYTIAYSNGPAYGSTTLYRLKDGSEIVTAFNFSADLNAVVPLQVQTNQSKPAS